MIIKKFSFIYISLCLKGRKDLYLKAEKDIAIKEENETLREKYLELLRNLKTLYNNGKLTLNQRSLSKLQLYFEEEKVLKAAGMETEISVKEKKRN